MIRLQSSERLALFLSVLLVAMFAAFAFISLKLGIGDPKERETFDCRRVEWTAEPAGDGTGKWIVLYELPSASEFARFIMAQEAAFNVAESVDISDGAIETEAEDDE